MLLSMMQLQYLEMTIQATRLSILRFYRTPHLPLLSNTQTRSGLVSKPPKRYDVGMHNDVSVLLSQLTEVLDSPDWSVHHQPHFPTALHPALDECDPLVCLANRIRMEDATDLGRFCLHSQQL